MYFYHLLPKGSDIRSGVVSLWWQYHHDQSTFHKNSDKYRERLCYGWGIYPNRDPDSLEDEEIFIGINKFRKSAQGVNQVYLFRFPPYRDLGRKMAQILDSRDIYRIDLFRKETRRHIRKIYFGYEGSFTGNRKLTLGDYQITPKEYFQRYTETSPLLFASLNHISVEPRNGILPCQLWELVPTPTTIEEVESLYYDEKRIGSQTLL